MPPRKKKTEEAVVVILDVGSEGEEDQTSPSSFFQKAKECLLGLIKKKIFMQSQELISLVLMNTEETLNDLNTNEDGYNNIKIAFPLRMVSWDLARLVDGLQPTRINSVDWLDAMAVALHHVRQEQESDCISLSNVVLISRLAGVADADQANMVLRQLKTLASELTVIGYGVDQIQQVSQQYSQNNKKSLHRLQNNLSLVSDMVKKMNSSDKQNSALCSFDETLSHLTFFKGKPVRPSPWRTDLEIGADIKFEVVGYKLVAEQENFKFSTQKRGDENTTVYRDVKTFMEMDDQGDEREVAAEDIVKSYVFGDKIIPFSTYDSETMTYKSGPRSLKLIGFTKQRNIPKYILQGKGVIAFTSGQSSAVAFAALYEALVSLNLVGLVRRVYQRDNAPTIGTLYPETLNGKKMLTFIELPFAEDVNALKFPSLQHVTPTTEQKNAVNKLISALDLSDPNDPDNELFNPENTYDPHRQFMYHVFTQQILHPDEPSPTEPPEHVKKLRSLPPEMKEKAEPIMELIRQLFPLAEVEKKQWRKGKASDGASEEKNKEEENENSADVEQTGMASVFKPTVVQVTTQQPVQDFEILLKKGENHTEVCNQMKKVITVLAQRIVEADDLLKLTAALKTLRKSCLEKNPTLYNNWLPELKNLVQERKLNSLWEKVEEEQLGLISNKETATSSIPEEDANSFLKLGSLEVEQEVDGDDLMMDL